MIFLLLNLVMFVLVSAIIHGCATWFVRQLPMLQRSPMFFIALALLALSVWLPWPADTVPLQIPSHLLQDSGWHIQQWTAKAEHPRLLQSPQFGAADVVHLMLLLIGSISMLRLLCVARRYWLLQQQVKAATPLAAPFASWPAGVALRQFDQAHSAFACGVWRPTVMVPTYLNSLSIEQQHLLLRHELAHLARYDAVVLLGWQLLLALAWFNPWLRHWYQAWQQAAELQVDQQICQAASADTPAPTNVALLYAQTMLQCLKLNQQSAQQQAMAWSSGVQQYQQRLTELFQPQPLLSRRQGIVVGGAWLAAAILLAAGCSQLQQPTAPLQWSSPVALHTPISSPFGEVLALRQHKPHLGIDLAGAAGAPVYASARASVVVADAKSLHANYGNAVLLDHGAGYQTLYAHLDHSVVQVGQIVERGQLIGFIGQSGKVTGPHLHFEWLRHGVQQDPTALLEHAPPSH